MNIYTNELDDMTKMAAMPIYDKKLKNLLFQNQQIDSRVTSGTQVILKLFK